VLEFLDAVLARCRRTPTIDDQTNLFEELYSPSWLGSDRGGGAGANRKRAIACTNGEAADSPIHGFSWPEASAGQTAVLRVCPLPRLTFAAGFGHSYPEQWREGLSLAGKSRHAGGASEGTAAVPIVVHFNCLGRGGGHDAKKAKIERSGLWIWSPQAPDGGSSGGSNEGVCVEPSSTAIGLSWGAAVST
jgi:hypothetical protein